MTDRNKKERDRLRLKRTAPDYLDRERAKQAARMREARASGKASVLVGVMLKPELYEALDRAAEREDRTVAGLLRWLAMEFVRQHPWDDQRQPDNPNHTRHT